MSRPAGRIYFNSHFERAKDACTGETHMTRIYSPCGCLFTNHHRASPFKPEDLPEWYVKGYYWKQHGFLSAKGVKDVVFAPSDPRYDNHAMKDCCLYVSYSGQITLRDAATWPCFGDYYIAFGGTEIVDFLFAAEKWSGLDISLPLSSVLQHLENFKVEYPEQTWVNGYLVGLKKRIGNHTAILANCI